MGLNLDRVLSEYDEDSVHSNGDIGQYVLAVVQDTLASSAADGDYGSFKTNLKGELYSHDADAIALLTTIDADTGSIATDASTIAGDTTSIDNTLTGLSKAEDAVHGDGDQGIMALGVRNDAEAALAADGDYIPFMMNSSGALITATELSAPNTSIDNQAVTVGTTEVALPTTAEPGRNRLIVQNKGNDSIYVGKTGVTTANGLEISKRSSFEIELGPSVTLYGISGSAGQDVRVFEAA